MRRGHEVTVVCPRFPGTSSGVIRGVRVVRVPTLHRRPFVRSSFVAGLSALLLAWLPRFDLVHIHLAGAHTDAVVLLSKLWRRPTYVKIAAGGEGGDVAFYSTLPGLPRYFGLLRADRLQALSGEIVDDLTAIGVPRDRIVRVPNGLDLSGFAPATPEERAAARRRLELPPGATIALYVGRIARPKGVYELVEAWERPPLEHARLLLVGTVNPHAHDLALPANTILRGFSWNIADYYRAADLFVLPSLAEGMSNALLEAMACGLPAVATRVGAAEEMLEDGPLGLLVPPGDVAALGDAIERLVSDPELRAALGSAAAEAASGYSVDAVVDRLLEAYEGLLADR